MSAESWTQNGGLGNNHDTQAYEFLHRSESCSAALLIVVNEKVVVYLFKNYYGISSHLKGFSTPQNFTYFYPSVAKTADVEHFHPVPTPFFRALSADWGLLPQWISLTSLQPSLHKKWKNYYAIIKCAVFKYAILKRFWRVCYSFISIFKGKRLKLLRVRKYISPLMFKLGFFFSFTYLSLQLLFKKNLVFRKCNCPVSTHSLPPVTLLLGKLLTVSHYSSWDFPFHYV